MSCMEVLESIKCFVVDMDGTFYLGNSLLPGAKEFAQCVEKSGKRFFFFTNNSSHNEEECLGKLRKYGYDEEKYHGEKRYQGGENKAAVLMLRIILLYHNRFHLMHARTDG